MSWSEGRITKMLRQKHAGDIFVPKCKDGATERGLRVLDGWVMPRSWSHPQCVGYEIKVSRSDWLGDRKWPTYLPLCHQLYIVCPYKLLKKDEIPDPLGLIWAHEGESQRLTTAKKAAIRDVQIPESLFRYVLMNRASIEENVPPRGPDKEAWENWLADRQGASALGPRVSKKIKELQESENHKLKSETLASAYEKLNAKHEKLLKVLYENGHYLGYDEDEGIRRLAAALKLKGTSVSAVRQAEQLKRIGESISRVEQELRELCAKEAE